MSQYSPFCTFPQVNRKKKLNYFKQQQHFPAHFMNISTLANNAIKEIIQPLQTVEKPFIWALLKELYSSYLAVTFQTVGRLTVKTWINKKFFRHSRALNGRIVTSACWLKANQFVRFFLNYKYPQARVFWQKTAEFQYENISRIH